MITTMQLNRHQVDEFLEKLWRFYEENGRDLPWRRAEPDDTFNAYKIMVSELMLQQTQVPRVIPKYEAFLREFPNVQALAGVELGDVLRAWQGLGYNRRAKFLWQAAGAIVERGSGPDTLQELTELPGVGVNTAGAILAYAFNQPAIFVETNVRTVYIHEFLADTIDVPDKIITRLLEQTLDQEHPREFYWALMDYGSYLKTTVGNLNKASKHYAKQSTFEGSRRQIRGKVLRLLGKKEYTLQEMRVESGDERLESVVGDLVAEGLIRLRDSKYSL